SIGENDRNTDHPGFTENDGLGNALQKLNKKLLAARKEDQRRMVEEQKRNWFNEGLAQFAGIFRSDEENIGELAYLIIYKLVKYLGASHGMFFILNEEDDKTVRTFDLTAAFALDRRKFLQKKIYPGEGLAGTAALDKQTIFLTDIPDEYITITTGLGESPPRSLLIVPLINEKESIGILEIASFGILTDLEIEFVEKLSESLSTTLSSARKNIKTMKLLRQTKLQAEEMARQEEEMRKNIYEMERTQEESIRKEFEMNGILNAINNSSMMAEYSLNGRFAKINEKFAALLELPPAQIIGKHHSEFSTANRHSPEYKTFWHELKNGKTKFLHEEFQLFNGRKNWLRQTYTPIQNNEGKTVKILNIAYDITETRLQQESLKRQSEEIARKNIEMRSLSEAVDQSIIKCELSPEGIVMQVNTNYCEVTGLSATELLGKNLRLFLKESEIKSLNLILNQVVKGKIYSGVVRRTKPTGEQTWLMSNFSPVKDEKGKVCKIYFLAQDITEKRLKYQLLEEANKEIERLRSKPDTNKG
ncbi:MAG: PAS domain-containing protein, partial [Bacteroidota bacterium]